jgi:hypothetical protein
LLAGEPIVTWGGREYYPEAPRYDKRYGRDMTYEYKLLNYAHSRAARPTLPRKQFSAITATPESAGASWSQCTTRLTSVLRRLRRITIKDEMAVLKEAMESIECDVPMLTDGKLGPNWASLKDMRIKWLTS